MAFNASSAAFRASLARVWCKTLDGPLRARYTCEFLACDVGPEFNEWPLACLSDADMAASLRGQLIHLSMSPWSICAAHFFLGNGANLPQVPQRQATAYASMRPWHKSNIAEHVKVRKQVGSMLLMDRWSEMSQGRSTPCIGDKLIQPLMMGILIMGPYKPLLLGWWVYPLLYGNNGSLDPGTTDFQDAFSLRAELLWQQLGYPLRDPGLLLTYPPKK